MEAAASGVLFISLVMAVGSTRAGVLEVCHVHKDGPQACA